MFKIARVLSLGFYPRFSLPIPDNAGCGVDLSKKLVVTWSLKALYFIGAHNEGFLLHTSETLFRLSRVLLDL